MRRVYVVCCIWLLALTLGITVASAQGVRTASPPITRIELNGFEPLPPGIPEDIFYGGLGGGGGDITITPFGPHWDSTPGALATGYGAFFSACGYVSTTPPTATLTYPSGVQTRVEVNSYVDAGNCADYTLNWQYGLELGIYTLTFAHSEGTLTHTFGYDYPMCWYHIPSLDGLEWVMGLTPNEQITLYFYTYPDGESNTRFVAERSARADENGALVIDIQVGRTAPFTRDLIFFATIGVGRVYYDINPAIGAFMFEELGFEVPTFPSPNPTYPHLYLSYSSFFSQDTLGRSCDGEFGRFAQVFPYPNGVGSVPLYANVNDTNSNGSLPAGTIVEVLESRPSISSGRVLAWKFVRAENGRTGWTPSNDFIGVFPDLVPGVRAEVRPIGVYEASTGFYRPGPQPVFSTPAGQIIREVPPGTEVIMLESRDLADNVWWNVRFSDGSEGWMYAYEAENFTGGFDALPWATVSVASGGTGNSGSSTIAASCPNSPPSRLIPGRVGRVTPGDPNRLRAAPESGTVLGNIPAGSTFAILAGPQCGAQNGLAWWQVEYNGQVGWTAEGQGSEYWLELVN